LFGEGCGIWKVAESVLSVGGVADKVSDQLVDEVDVLFKQEFHGITCNPISWTANPNVAFSVAWS